MTAYGAAVLGFVKVKPILAGFKDLSQIAYLHQPALFQIL